MHQARGPAARPDVLPRRESLVSGFVDASRAPAVGWGNSAMALVTFTDISGRTSS